METIKINQVLRPKLSIYNDGGEVELSFCDFIPKLERSEDFTIVNGVIKVDYNLPHQATQKTTKVGAGDYKGQTITYVGTLLAPCKRGTQQLFKVTAADLQDMINNTVNEGEHGSVITAVSCKSDLTGKNGNVANPAIYPYVNHPKHKLMWDGILQNVKTDKQMTVGVHLLNPVGNLYDKVIELPENCTLVSFEETAPIYFTDTRLGDHLVPGSVSVVQTGNTITIHAEKVPSVSAMQFAKIIPLTLTFEFNIDNLEVHNFGDGCLDFVYLEVPAIKGCIGRYSI